MASHSFLQLHCFGNVSLVISHVSATLWYRFTEGAGIEHKVHKAFLIFQHQPRLSLHELGCLFILHIHQNFILILIKSDFNLVGLKEARWNGILSCEQKAVFQLFGWIPGNVVLSILRYFYSYFDWMMFCLAESCARFPRLQLKYISSLEACDNL